MLQDDTELTSRGVGEEVFWASGEGVALQSIGSVQTFDSDNKEFITIGPAVPLT